MIVAQYTGHFSCVCERHSLRTAAAATCRDNFDIWNINNFTVISAGIAADCICRSRRVPNRPPTTPWHV